MQQTSGQRCGIFGFLANIICGNELDSRKIEFWPPNTSKEVVSKFPGAKVGSSHRGMQLFNEKLAESMSSRDD